MSAKHTPGPLFVVHVDKYPFDIQIQDAHGNVIHQEPRYAHSTQARSIADVMSGVGFRGKEKDEAVAANARQLADICLRAAAPDLLEALRSTINLLWIEDSRSVQLDGTVMFGPDYDFSGLNGGRRSEFLWPGFDCIVWPGGWPDRKWSAYCTYEGSMWFEKFDTEEQAKEQCFRLLERVMPEHPVSKARAAIAKVVGDRQ